MFNMRDYWISLATVQCFIKNVRRIKITISNFELYLSGSLTIRLSLVNMLDKNPNISESLKNRYNLNKIFL